MTKLTDEENAQRRFDRMFEKAREYSVLTYRNKFVAPVFQRMVRAEWAAKPACRERAIIHGKLQQQFRRIGQCVCVTCGLVLPWSSNIEGMHTGHFLASRRNSIVFDELNVAPQCATCNYRQGGRPQEFRQWMLAVRGVSVVQALEWQKTQTVQFTKEELVSFRIEYMDRLKLAELEMKEKACRNQP